MAIMNLIARGHSTVIRILFSKCTATLYHNVHVHSATSVLPLLNCHCQFTYYSNLRKSKPRDSRYSTGLQPLSIEDQYSDNGQHAGGSNKEKILEGNVWKNKKDFLQSLLNEEKYTAHQEALHLLNDHRFKAIISKINFLVESGFTIEEILNNKHILIHSLKKIKKFYTILITNHIDSFSLDKLATFIRVGKIQTPRKTKEIKNLLSDLIGMQWNMNQEEQPPRNVVTHFADQERLQIMENYNFLTQQGFCNEDLRAMFLVLGHDSSVLKHHWKEFLKSQLSGDQQTLQKKSSKEKAIFLNILQYNIEKEQNFQHVIVLNTVT